MTTTIPKNRRPVVKTLADFRRHGLIGKWFGELELIGVEWPPSKPSATRSSRKLRKS